MSRLGIAGVAVAAVLLAAGPAHADRSVVVFDVDGARSDDLRDDLIEVLEDAYDVVPGSFYDRVAKRIGADGMAPDEVMKVAIELEVDAIVEAQLEPDGDGAHLLRLQVRAGTSGEVVKRLAVRVYDGEIGRKSTKKLRVRLLEQIDDLPSIFEVMPEDEPEPVVRKKAKKKKAKKKKAKKKKAKAEKKKKKAVAVKAKPKKKKAKKAKKKKAEPKKAKKKKAVAVKAKPKKKKAKKKKAKKKKAKKKAVAVKAKKKKKTKTKKPAEPEPKAEKKAKKKAKKKKAKKKKAKKKKPEKPFKIKVKRDDRGTIVDDEIPDALR
jgi:hypothetical protein